MDAGAGCLTAWTGTLFVIGAVYASGTVGISGGPNKGEHPFLVTVLHLLCFLVLARRWPWGPWGLYLALLGVALAASVAAIGLASGRRPARVWAMRAFLLALHGALFAVAWTVPPAP
jgi:hypothetical protein